MRSPRLLTATLDVQMLRRSRFWLIAVVVFAIVAWQSVGFVQAFELLGPAVHSRVHGWLGPTPRGSSCVADIGKVNDWRCDDISIFRKHRIGCRVWLLAFGHI